MIPDHLNDGYSSWVRGRIVRMLTPKDLNLAQKMCQEGDDFEDWLFSDPRVIGNNCFIDDDDKCEIFKRMTLMTYDVDSLKKDVQFFKDYPELSNRNCNMCRKYWLNHSTGEAVDRGDGKPLLRHAASLPACETDAGCAKGHWSNQTGISALGRSAIEHFKEFKNVGCPLPLCPVMRSNWNIMTEAGI